MGVYAIYGYGGYGEVLEHMIEAREPGSVKYIIDDYKIGLRSNLLNLEILDFDSFTNINLKNCEVYIATTDPSLQELMAQKLSQIGVLGIVEKEICNYISPYHLFSKSEADLLIPKIEKVLEIFESEEDKELYQFIFDLRISDGSILKKVDSFRVRSWERQYCDFINPNYIRNVIDGGIFDGYTLSLMFKNLYTNSSIFVYGFEPCKSYVDNSCCRDKLKCSSNNMELIYKALWSKNTKLYFLNKGASSQVNIYGDGLEIEAVSIDSFTSEREIKVDFIKLDVEGTEIEVLKGAVKTIKNCRPQIAISIYHTKEHFYEIPLILKELCPDYVFKIARYSNDTAETILYAIPKEIEVINC